MATISTDLDTLRRAQRSVGRVALEDAQLRRENRYLRRLLAHNGRYGRLLRRAHDDALAMLQWRHAGYYTSRDWCCEMGMSERRWTWARALLMAARLWEHGDIAPVRFDVAADQLAQTVKRIRESDDDQLQVLRSRMPKKYALWR